MEIKNENGIRIRIVKMALALTFCLAWSAHAQTPKYKVLDFWGVGGFAHDSRMAANTLLDSLAKILNIQIDKSDQATVFTAANLAQYRVVILNNSTELGKILNTDQRTALLDFMKKNGLVGFHGSGDTKGSWPEYTTYLGGELSSHGVGIATLNIDPAPEAISHPIMAGLPITTAFSEEWYAYKTNPRLAPGVRILYTLDENSCPNCTKMGGDHPIAWTREDASGGRTFYYAMGHGSSIFQKNLFCINMLKQAIQWAAKETPLPIVRPTHDGRGMMALKPGMGALTVETFEPGLHTVEVSTLDGRRVASRSGRGPQSYTFANLPASTLYALTIRSKFDSQRRLVALQ